MQAPSSAELARVRAKLYEFMSAQYLTPPAADFVEFVAGWVSLQLESEELSELLSPDMKTALAEMQGFFRSHDEQSWEELSEAVSIDFTRLFRGVKQNYSPPPPYESVYREEEGRVFGGLTAEVRNEYRRHGFDLAPGFTSEPPDHVSFELAFMNALCSREAEARDKGDQEGVLSLWQAQKEFLEKHLLAWVSDLRARVEEFDQSGFYSGVVRFTEAWANFDYHSHLAD